MSVLHIVILAGSVTALAGALALGWVLSSMRSDRLADRTENLDVIAEDTLRGAFDDAAAVLQDLTPPPPLTPTQLHALHQIEHDLIGDPDFKRTYRRLDRRLQT